MARSLSVALLAGMYAQQTGEALLPLVTITHPSLDAPFRFVADGQNLTSRGNVFVAFPFDVVLPGDEEEQAPAMRLVVDNVLRAIIASLREVTDSPLCTVELVRAEAPDTVEIPFSQFELTEATTTDAATLTLDLTLDDVTSQRYPADHYVASLYPGLAAA